MAEKDWVAWHDGYDDEGSLLAHRLAVVQEQIRVALDGFPPGPIRVVSMCAGQGRDLLGVLADHPRAADVRARLVELDPHNASIASASGLSGVETVVADAGLTDSYAGAVPADLVLACGVFGNITDADVARTVEFLPQLCAPGGTVIWTRHREPPDLVPTLCGWLASHGFTQRYVSPAGLDFGVGAFQFTGTPAALAAGERIFTFVGRAGLA